MARIQNARHISGKTAEQIGVRVSIFWISVFRTQNGFWEQGGAVVLYPYATSLDVIEQVHAYMDVPEECSAVDRLFGVFTAGFRKSCTHTA